MQLRLAAVLITALPAIASAAQCTEETATKAPDFVITQFEKVNNATQAVVDKFTGALLTSEAKLHKRQDNGIFEPIDCTSSEICIDVEATSMCYNEETTVARAQDDITITLKNGDYVLPGNAKGNMYTDTKAMEEYLLKQLTGDDDVEQLRSAVASASSSLSNSTAANATASLQPSASDDADSAAGKLMVGGWIATVAALAAIIVA